MTEIEKLKECGTLQLSEVEMLDSMFPNAAEFSVDREVLRELKQFVDGSDVVPPNMEYTVNLSIDKVLVSLHAVIPSLYPVEPPDIYVRSNSLTRYQQNCLNTSLNEFLKSIDKGDLVVGLAIFWLQENSKQYLTDETATCQSPKKEDSEEDLIFNRYWIYSHHIYSKVKRKDIKDLADEYQLTGFCLPGKPGIMCVEGTSRNIKDWWQTVRSWNWQKIMCKKIEDETLSSSSELGKHRRFSNFQELGSDSNIRVKSSGYHVDMGDLFRYLSDHNSSYMFEEYFGVQGK